MHANPLHNTHNTPQYNKQHKYNRINHEFINDNLISNTKYDRTYLLKIFMATKPALASWGTPPRGEPGEPRLLGLRTLSSQQRGAISINTIPRLRNQNRGIRSPEKTNQRKQRAKTNQRIARTQTREYRTSTPLETRRGLARCVSNTTYMTKIIGLLKTATTTETAMADTTWDTKEHC